MTIASLYAQKVVVDLAAESYLWYKIYLRTRPSESSYTQYILSVQPPNSLI
jgi:hypothetical protein